MFVAGVDGSRSGWVAVALERGAFAGAAGFDTFREVLRALPEAVAIGVDIPIGLLESSHRVCDALTRVFVGPRRSSVFLTPPRDVVDVPDYERANERCREITGHGLSKQAFNLRKKILEVDAVVHTETTRQDIEDRAALTDKPRRHLARRVAEKPESRDSLRRFARIIEPSGHTGKDGAALPLPAGRIVEVHPEASFRQLAGAPLEHPKKTEEGIRQRMELLAGAGIVVPGELPNLGDARLDDVLDAAAAAWTADRYARHEARSLPPPELWERDGKRVVAIWI